MVSKVEPDGPITVGDMKIMAPGFITKYMTETGFNSLANPIKLELKKKWIEFLLEIFDIVITKEPVFLNSDQNFEYLMEFLKNNQMSHMADFLEKYEKY